MKISQHRLFTISKKDAKGIVEKYKDKAYVSKTGCWMSRLTKKRNETTYRFKDADVDTTYMAQYWSLRVWRDDEELKLALSNDYTCRCPFNLLCFNHEHLVVEKIPLRFSENTSRTKNLVRQTDKALASMSQGTAQALLDSLKPTTLDNGCCKSVEGGRPDDDGYIRISTSFKCQTQVYASRVVLVANGRDDDLTKCFEIEGSDIHHCSHLCHNVKCTESEHIVVEKLEENVSRNTCTALYNFDITLDGNQYIYRGCPHNFNEKCCMLKTIVIKEPKKAYYCHADITSPDFEGMISFKDFRSVAVMNPK